MNRHSRTALIAAATAALCASTVSAFAASTTWVPTATQGVSVSRLLSASDLGPLSPSEPLTVRVGLQTQHKSVLAEVIKAVNTPASPYYGHYLTPAQFTAAFAPSTSQVNQVVAYLQQAGFTNIVVEPNNLIVSANGTAATAAAAFHTRLESFSQFGQQVYGNLTPAEVPSALGSIVGAVLGLNTVGKMKPTISVPGVPQYPATYTPVQFQKIYNATTIKPACCTAIAIMAEGNVTGVINDLRIAEKAFALPQVPVKVVQVGLASPDVSGADEFDLDTQYASGMAENLKELYVYDTTSLTDSDLALEFSRFVTDNKARAGSASLGECEAFPYLDGSMLVDDETFAEAAAQGQTFFASSGDTGSFCPAVVGENGVPAGAPLVNYPASSPYVIGVGGTTLLTNADGSYDQETSWYAGGGGLSQFEAPPFWQSAAVTLVTAENTRGVPDISYDADPNSGALVYVNGVAEGVGGTSLSSPLALGAWARVINTDWKLGNAGPALYSLYDGASIPPSYPHGGFHDILIGVNGFYPTTPGYDLNTGLGTMIVDQITADLAKY